MTIDPIAVIAVAAAFGLGWLACRHMMRRRVRANLADLIAEDPRDELGEDL